LIEIKDSLSDAAETLSIESERVGDGEMPDGAEKPVYLHEMMVRLGIDPAGGVEAHSGLTYLTALHRCQTCKSTEKCRVWLDHAPADAVFAPRFCPNNDLLFELQIDQRGHIRGPTNDLCKAAKTTAPDRGET
jgi:hypothetical protein